MDYGQTSSSTDKEAIFSFTPTGDGESPENTLVERDFGDIGNTAIFSPETPEAPETPETPETPEASPKTPEAPNQLGQVIPLEMPPITEPEPETPKSPSEHLADMSQITRENDKISFKTVKAVEKATADFNRGVISPADLDNFVSDATETYMKTFGGYAKWKGGE